MFWKKSPTREKHRKNRFFVPSKFPDRHVFWGPPCRYPPREAEIKLIGNTTTEAGLQVQAALDKRKYPTCQKVSDEQLSQVRLTTATFHGDWNYTVAPDR
jgi:hypothetical protein